jgi:Sensors of blue-light using FAD
MSSPDSLFRLAYTSTCSAAPAKREAVAQAIAQAAGAHNARLGITGMLALVNERFLQVLEGPSAALEALFARIRADGRHTGVTLMSWAPVESPMFADWSMGLVERSESAAAVSSRAETIQRRLAEGHEISATDLLRWMFAPSANPPSARAEKRQDSVTRIALASPSGVWNAAVLQHLAGDKRVRVGRSQIADVGQPHLRALLEYADMDVDGVGSVRALSVSRNPAECPLMAPLVEQLSLLVFLLAPSEQAQFMPFFAGWVKLPQVVAARPRLLLLTSLSDENCQALMQTLRQHTDLPIAVARVRLSDPASIWSATQDALPERSARAAVALTAASSAAAEVPAEIATDAAPPKKSRSPRKSKATKSPSAPSAPSAPAATAARKRATAPAETQAWQQALADSECLDELMQLDGAMEAAVLVSEPPGVIVFKSAGAVQDDAQMQGHAQFLSAKQQLVRQLVNGDDTEEIVVVTRDSVSLFRLLPGHTSLFLGLTLSRQGTSVGVARLRLQEVVQALDHLSA